MVVSTLESEVGPRGWWVWLFQFGAVGLAVSVLAALICLLALVFRRRIPRGMPLAIGLLAVLSLTALGGVAAIVLGTANETVK